MNKMKKCYSTKYALTRGIVEITTDEDLKSKEVIKDSERNYYSVGVNVFEKKEDAYRKAELMRVRNIKSLKKQLTKLESMSFKI